MDLSGPENKAPNKLMFKNTGYHHFDPPMGGFLMGGPVGSKSGSGGVRWGPVDGPVVRSSGIILLNDDDRLSGRLELFY